MTKVGDKFTSYQQLHVQAVSAGLFARLRLQCAVHSFAVLRC